MKVYKERYVKGLRNAIANLERKRETQDISLRRLLKLVKETDGAVRRKPLEGVPVRGNACMIGYEEVPQFTLTFEQLRDEVICRLEALL